jgi:hypothetical protein
MTHPKVDYNDNMSEMRDYDEEDWEKKGFNRLLVKQS